MTPDGRNLHDVPCRNCHAKKSQHVRGVKCLWDPGVFTPIDLDEYLWERLLARGTNRKKCA